VKRGVRLFVVTLCAAFAAFNQDRPNRAAGQTLPAPPAAAGGQAAQVAYEKGPPPAAMLPKPDQRPTVLLWPQGAPGSEGMTGEETYRIQGDLLVVSNVHRPSITLYLPPKGKATGAGVIVTPGGAGREIYITNEGYRVADWLSQRGIAAFVLKYRLPRAPGSAYTNEDHSLPDIQRAIRLVRSRAAEWSVDADRVGVMGFSAGGRLAGLAGARYNDAVKRPVDSVDRLSARPAFMALMYGTPFTPPMKDDVQITRDLPPVFLCAGSEDRIAAGYPDVFQRMKEAGVSVELHLFAGVGHGFAIGYGAPAVSQSWPGLFRAWLFERGFLTKQ
jgi:acetyl esterase/lipase